MNVDVMCRWLERVCVFKANLKYDGVDGGVQH